ncbi:MAG: DUF3795 domain-containing protein [Alistipes sp.]|nr:DUF3795 domain-containing protein [Alistipes sp.]
MTTRDKIASTAPCGLDCFNCRSHEANVTPEYRARAAEMFGVSPEEVGCKGGCRAVKGHCLWTRGLCATYACAETKGVEYCFECDEFPCSRLAPSKDSAVKDYPHNFKLFNLCRMKAVGVEKWVEEEADKIREIYYTGAFVVGDSPVKQQ